MNDEEKIQSTDMSCSVCPDCGSITFEHRKSDIFTETLTVSNGNVWVEREYEQGMLPGDEEIVCVECKQSEQTEVCLDGMSMDELKQFFGFKDKERLKYLKEKELVKNEESKSKHKTIDTRSGI